VRVPDRREFFVAAGGALGAAALAGHPVVSAPADRGPLTVLFQGDSITDNGRDRKAAAPNTAGQLGGGYPYLIAAAALAAEPTRGLRFFNRGVSGDKVPDLTRRWPDDTLALKPNVRVSGLFVTVAASHNPKVRSSATDATAIHTRRERSFEPAGSLIRGLPPYRREL
jgi:lysophospholipase L1-like esterase